MQTTLPEDEHRHPNQIQLTSGFTWIWNAATLFAG